MRYEMQAVSTSRRCTWKEYVNLPHPKGVLCLVKYCYIPRGGLEELG